jgi:conjugal transfer pilus assembly protein TraA
MKKLTRNQTKSLIVLVATVSTFSMSPEIMAGTGGSEFNDIYNLIVGWMQGTFGRLITIALLLTGIGFGVVKQSVVAAVPAIAAALIMNSSDNVINAIVSAVI